MARQTYGLAFALVLSPAFLQSGQLSCSGNTTLSSLEFETDGENQIAFSPSVKSYELSTSADSALLRATASDASARVRYQWYVDGALVDEGELGVGGGEVTTDIPLGEATLRVRVLPSGGAVTDYTIDVCRCGTAFYDRTNPVQLTPFPDDFWLANDPSTPSGKRVLLQVPPREADVGVLFAALMNETILLDGFSPIGGVVIELSDEPDPSSLPMTPNASLDPNASLRLYNVTPSSPTFGERVPFQLTAISRALPGQAVNHALILYPAVTLDSRATYAVVLTKDALTLDQRPYQPSTFMKATLSSPVGGEAAEVTRIRDLLFPDVIGVVSSPSLGSDAVPFHSIALVARFSTRSTDDLPLTPLSMREQIHTMPPPTYQVTSVSQGPGDVATIVRGTFQAPNFLENQFFIARDPGGDPRMTGTVNVPFVFALPNAAASGPVPVVMFQHGSPGSSEQVWWEAQWTLAAEGFAVVGMTDTLNRVLGEDLDIQNRALFQALLDNWRFPQLFMQTYAEQMSFVRLIEQLGNLDSVPYPSGDGTPDLDLSAPLTYVGLSMGSVLGSGFLAYAPEIKAAAIAAGALRQGEAYFNLGAFIDLFPPDLGALLPNANPTDFWVGLSILQMVFDHQDPHLHSRYIYRSPAVIDGTTQRASLLLQEGLRDTNQRSLMRALAWTIGPLPHLEPVWEDSAILNSTTAPVSANVDPTTTAAFYQFVPAGVPNIPPTPGCAFEPEGHFCAQVADEARRQRALLLRSAVEEPVPTIIDPLLP